MGIMVKGGSGFWRSWEISASGLQHHVELLCGGQRVHRQRNRIGKEMILSSGLGFRV